MKKILFVNPSISNTVFGKMRMLALPPMGLGMLASMTPDGYEVEIVDENVDTLDFDTAADLVAVTATTVQAPRAYAIMAEFRKRGVKTILGGIHPSVCPDEALVYADSIAIGEGEEIWPVILNDFEKGRLARKYTAERFPSLENIPRINRELFSKKYLVQSVQTSRGCPCNCSFCSVTKFNGGRYRFRPTRDVIEEIAGIKDKRMFIADDSIVGLGDDCVRHALEVFQNLKGLGKTYGSQVCITIAEHDHLLRAAADAGVNTFYIGFESIEPESLKSVNKGVNLRPLIKNYRETIKKFHGYGIGIIGGFILGCDGDTPDVFDRMIDFVHETGIDGCQFTIMTPFPGTRLYDKVRKEGRLLYTDYPNDWIKYNAYEAVIRPLNMTVDELISGWRRVYDATSTMRTSLFRGVKTLINTRSFTNATVNVFWNYYNYRAIRDIN